MIRSKVNEGIPENKAIKKNDLVPLYDENEILLPRNWVAEKVDTYTKEGYNIIKIRPK